MNKIFLKLIIFFLVLSIASPTALAEFDYPSPSDAASDAMDQASSDLGIDNAALKDAISTLNVSNMKQTAPQVSLEFAPTNPKTGDQISAIASPTYFMNDPSNLYFTWFLKHSYCKDASSGEDDYNKKCDLNNDKKVDTEDYKIEAMRIIANGGFDWNKALGKDNPKCQATETQPTYCSLNNLYATSSNDSDGYKAVFGGDDQRGKSTHCYAHNVDSGNEYELPSCKHLFPDTNNDKTVGDENFGEEEELFWRTDPTRKDTAGTGRPDEANVAGLGAIQFKWNYQAGDKVGVAIEGVSTTPTQYKDSSYKTMWAMSKNKCSAGSVKSAPTDDKIITTTVTTRTASNYPIISTSTITTETAITVQKYRLSRTKLDGTLVFEESPYDTATTSSTSTAQAGSSDSTNKIVTTIVATRTAVNDSLKATSVVTTTTTTTIDSYSVTSDSGILPLVYTTTPSTSTASTTSTDSENRFDAEKDAVNKCLKDNLVEPLSGGESKRFDIVLSRYPENPINDPSENEKGDAITINSIITNSEDQTYIKYKWEVYKSYETDLSTGDWGEPLLKSQIPGAGQTVGIGLNSFKFNLNFKKPIPKFIKISLLASEQISKNTVNEGRSDLIIPISSTSNKIGLYQTTVSDSLSLSIDAEKERCEEGLDSIVCPVTKNEIVALKVDKANFTGFSWSFDGRPIEPLSYDEDTKTCLFGECGRDGEQTNVVYLPILKDEDETYEIEMSADNADGERITLSKTLVVADPKINILSDDMNASRPTLLGYYVDPINTNPNPVAQDASLWPDYNDNEFEALPAATIKLGANFSGISLNNIQWSLDGAILNEETAPIIGADIATDGKMAFPATKKLGGVYTISASALYTQNTNVKKFLNKYWGLQLDDFYEKQITDTITIKLTDYFSDQTVPLVSQKNTGGKKILASLVSGIPAYINFLFKIILTSVIFLLSSWTILSFFPKPNEN